MIARDEQRGAQNERPNQVVERHSGNLRGLRFTIYRVRTDATPVDVNVSLSTLFSVAERRSTIALKMELENAWSACELFDPERSTGRPRSLKILNKFCDCYLEALPLNIADAL